MAVAHIERVSYLYSIELYRYCTLKKKSNLTFKQFRNKISNVILYILKYLRKAKCIMYDRYG